MKSKLSYSCIAIICFAGIGTFLSTFPVKADKTETVTVQPEDPNVVNEVKELEDSKGKENLKGTRYQLMSKTCNNVDTDGKIIKPKADASKMCKKFYRLQINALKRAPFCKDGVSNLPPEIGSDEAKQIAAIIKKRCDAAFADESP
jgi:hypothetical protein